MMCKEVTAMDVDWITIEIDDARELASILTDAEVPEPEIPLRDEILAALRFKDAYELGELTAREQAIYWLADCLAMEVDRLKPFIDSPDRDYFRYADVTSWKELVWEQL
jgi:hypothetical protein